MRCSRSTLCLTTAASTGADLTRRTLASRAGPASEDTRGVASAAFRRLRLQPTRDTPYVATGPLWWLPGQGEWEQLTEKVRRAMARQILRGLKGAWPGDCA